MKILIINPNSSPEMTDKIKERALDFAAGEFEVDCLPTPGGIIRSTNKDLTPKSVLNISKSLGLSGRHSQKSRSL